MTELDRLPLHPVPEAARLAARHPCLAVGGLVERPCTLTPVDLQSLPRVRRAGSFACEEGWEVNDLHWEGVRLRDVLDAAGLRPEARYVRVGADDYVVPMTIAEAGEAMLCDTLDGRPLTLAEGAPFRLLVPGGKCFTSVKWVDRIEAAVLPGGESGKDLAMARLALERWASR